MDKYRKEKKAVKRLIKEASVSAVANPWRLAALYQMEDHLMDDPKAGSVQDLDPETDTYCEAFGDAQYEVEDEINSKED